MVEFLFVPYERKGLYEGVEELFLVRKGLAEYPLALPVSNAIKPIHKNLIFTQT